MARERPYLPINFRVKIGSDNGQGVNAGFQEVSGLGTEVTVAEYRAGNFMDNAPQKVNGNYKVPDVTLKRGLIGELATLHNWIKDVREGNLAALRTVTVELYAEDRSGPVQTWKLTNARPIKYTGPALSGKGTDVAIEELVLSCERIDIGTE